MEQDNFLIREIRNAFSPTGKMISRIIIINVVVFLVLRILSLAFFLSGNQYDTDETQRWLGVPSSFSQLLMKPWTIVTYAFTQYEFFHILFNMLWLYWLGMILTEYLGNKKILPVYMMGSWVGAALYILSYNIFPVFKSQVEFSYAIGASAGVMAIIVATAVLLPNHPIMLFIWQIRLKWLAVAFVALDLLGISSDGNAGGHIAHLGGALFGYLYIASYRNGTDLSRAFNKVADSVVSIFSGRRKMKVTYTKNTSQKFSAEKKKDEQYQKRIDSILDKISQSGYESLTIQEKEILFKASKDNN